MDTLQPNTMHDPSGTGELRLPLPDFRTSSEMVDAGPITVLALPEGHLYLAKNSPEAETLKPKVQPAPQQSDGVWVSIPQAPRTSPDTELWHYTDAAGAISILQNATLWASSTASLNDSSEYLHGRELLDQILHEVRISKYLHPLQKAFIEEVVELSDRRMEESGLYVLCASRAGHSLAQWRAYGGNTGHAIILDAQSDLTVVSDENLNYRVDSIFYTWRDVLYEADLKKDLLKRVLGYIAICAPKDTTTPRDTGVLAVSSVLAAAIGHCKEESFSEEQEARLLVRSVGGNSQKFRAGATGIIPYVEISGATSQGQRARDRSGAMKLPILRVAVGPFSGRNESAQGAALLLSLTGYSDVEVEVSRSTLR